MSNNYRPSAQKSDAPAGGRGKRPMNPLFMGIIIGLLLGILLALGIALFLSRSANPFIEKTRPVDALPTIAPRVDASGKPDAARPVPPAAHSGAAKDGGEKPRFEFYQILPGEKDPSVGAKKSVDTSANKISTAPNAAEVKRDVAARQAAAPVASGKESYFLQAGAFQSETDAEGLKAKIAFAGMEANVRSVNLADKGTLYRVRLGPYKSLEEVNRIKATLSQNGINAAVVRPE